jgi:hypothetical protein
MKKSIIKEESVIANDELDCCEECGHLWNDEGPTHYTDCRYFTIEEGEDTTGYLFMSDPYPNVQQRPYHL